MLPLNIAGITIGPTAATPTTTAVALNSLPKSPIFSPPFFHIISIWSPLKTALKINSNPKKLSTMFHQFQILFSHLQTGAGSQLLRPNLRISPSLLLLMLHPSNPSQSSPSSPIGNNAPIITTAAAVSTISLNFIFTFLLFLFCHVFHLR